MPARTQATQSVASRQPSGLSPERKAFWHSPYTNADAKVVQDKKKLPNLDAAKSVIGQAILQKNEASLQKLGVTRYNFDDHDCLTRFARSGFTDADVAQAKKSFDFLKGESTQHVKAYLGLKLRNVEYGYTGGMEMLKQHGITESKYDQHDLLAAYKGAGLGERHLQAAREKFDFLKGSTKEEVKAYLGLKVLNAKDGYGFAVDFLKQVGASRGWSSN